MKASTVLSALLFGTMAAAAPFDRRALVYKTEIVTETVVVYTTVYGDEPAASTPAASPTSSAGAFYEQQKPAPTSSPAGYPAASPSAAPQPSLAPQPSPAPAPVASPPAPSPPAPSSPAAPAYTSVEMPSPAPVPSPSPSPSPQPQPAPEPQPAPAPAPSPSPAKVEAPAPASSAPAPSAAAPAPATGGYASTSSIAAGLSFSNVDMTVYDNTGAPGACGVDLTDDMLIVAIAQAAWDAKGGSTYNVMTGASSNPWCGTEIEVKYNGASVKAKILDLCPGCKGPDDVDLSRGAWKALGLTEATRLKASWTVL